MIIIELINFSLFFFTKRKWLGNQLRLASGQYNFLCNKYLNIILILKIHKFFSIIKYKKKDMQ